MTGAIVDRLAERLDRHGDQTVSIVDDGARESESWARLTASGAEAVARVVDPEVVDPSRCVGICAEPSPAMVALVAGCLVRGRPFTIIPPPRGRGDGHHRTQTAARVAAADVACVVADPIAAASLEGVGVPVVALPPVSSRPSELDAPERVGGPVYVQFTSGSTRDPAAVAIGERQLLANLDAIADRRQLDPEQERFVSWLPLSHDMGLVGLLLAPLLLGGELTLMRPSAFTRAPGLWLSVMSEAGATFTAAPSFAFGYTADRGEGTGLDLSTLRTVVDAGERVHVGDAERFATTLAPTGLPASALCPCYGMAENTVAVSVPAPGTGLRSISVDGPHDGRPVAHALLGRPVAGTSVTIEGAGPDGFGEVLVTGSSLAAGYAATGPSSGSFGADGWLRTGDHGTIVDGELVVVGRAGDLLNVRGVKVSAEEVEQIAVEAGARPGRVAAVGTDDDPLCVVVATIDGTAEPTLPRRIRGEVGAALGMSPRVVFVDRSALPKTTSGKLKRQAIRAHLVGSAP